MDIIIKDAANRGKIKAIDSKSIAIRKILMAAIFKKETVIRLNNYSNDIKDILNALKALGNEIKIKENKVYIKKGKIKHASIHIDKSATAFRLLFPSIGFFTKDAKIYISKQLEKRNSDDLFLNMKNIGYEIKGKNPIFIKSDKLKEGDFKFSNVISSQFISACLIYIAKNGGKIGFDRLVSKDYINLTIDCLKEFGIYIKEKNNEFVVEKIINTNNINYEIEGDYSNASYFLSAGAFGDVLVENLNLISTQADRRILNILKDYGAKVEGSRVIKNQYNFLEVDIEENIDLFSILAILMTKNGGILKNIQRLRYKESNRIDSMASMLDRLSAKFEIGENYFKVYKSKLKGGAIESFDDHRIVMAAAIARNLTKEDIIIKDYEAVNKSYPTFFEDFEKLGGKFEIRRL
ncbi:MAG: 3-phosphoshikimate 1-carboxyvinyltransferase [Tissierellia bacterium]|nr:3-phosphoshikimate 1-carboxyvinyltransferase [Tissierellia bacterium]